MMSNENMKNKIPKTNAMRILDEHNILYEVVTYEVDLEHLDACHVANSLGLDIDRVFKTIVMTTDDKRIFVFCIPASFQISLKKARVLTNSKEIDLVKLENLQKLTGYVRGGCSPLGMIKTYPVFIAEEAQLYDYIYVSAGLRGCQLKIDPIALRDCCNASFASLCIE